MWNCLEGKVVFRDGQWQKRRFSGGVNPVLWTYQNK